jgi:hypothetical protein
MGVKRILTLNTYVNEGEAAKSSEAEAARSNIVDLDMRQFMKGRPRSMYAKLWEDGGLRREDFVTMDEAAAMVNLSRRQFREFLDVFGVETLSDPEDLRKKLVPKYVLEELQRQRRVYEASRNDEGR